MHFLDFDTQIPAAVASGEDTSYVITQLTDNTYQDYDPQIHGGQVTWAGSDGYDWQIFLYDSATDATTQLTDLTDDISNVWYPQIHNGQVTWQGSTGGNSEIFLATPAIVDKIDTALELMVPDTLVRGEDFVLEACLHTSPPDSIPIVNEPITFSINVTSDNGTVQAFTDSVSTNVQGIARFILSSDTTKEIKQVLGVEASYPGSNTYQPTHVIVDAVNLPRIQLPTKTQSVQAPASTSSKSEVGPGFTICILLILMMALVLIRRQACHKPKS